MNTRTIRHSTARPAARSVEIGTLLGIWAHPDDEAYLSAGLMSTVRASGGRVVVATATKGEVGTDDPNTYPPERLARVREREMAASLRALGVTEHHWLGHHDGTLYDIPVEYGIRQAAALIEDVRPDTIVTFGPDGMTGHVDHQTVSDWVTTAWHRTGRRARLWYPTVTPEFHQEWGEVNSAVGFWYEGATPPSDPSSDLEFTVHCDEGLLDRKVAALRAHTSQTTGLINLIGPDRYRRWWATESFIDATRRIDDRAVA